MIQSKIMEVKKDIGKAFRGKLDNLERLPGDALWDTITKDLDKKKKKQFPYFWFYIYSLPALVCVVYLLFYVSPDYTPIKKQDNIQSGAPVHNTAPSPKENTLVNNKFKDSSANGIANSTSKVNDVTGKDTLNSHLTNKNTTTGNNTVKKESSDAEDKKKKTNKAGFATIKNHNSLGNKAHTTNGVNHQKKTLHNVVKTDKNATNSKTRNKHIKYSTQLRGLEKRGVLASGEDTVKSGNLDSGSDNHKLPTEVKQNTLGNSNSNTISQNNSVTAKGKDTGSEIGTIGKTLLSVNDSLAATIPIAKDSLKTEIPKELLAEQKKKKDSLIPIIKRFSFFAYGGPSFFSFPERKIITDSTTSNITTKSATRFGVLFGYRLNSKLSIRTGLSFYNLKQSAANIKLNYTMATNELLPPEDFRWIDYNYPYGFNNSLIISTLGSNYQALINIDRELSYFEIPLEINYTLLDNKFGIKVTGGGSLLLLTKNEVFAYNENGKMYLGTWNAAAKTSFTGSFGIGLHYNLSPSLQINADPMFTYYFETYKDSKPYSMNIRLGMQYNFDIGSTKK